MAQSTTTANARRRADLAMIHIGAKALFGDVSKGGDGRDDYVAWLERHTGKASSAKLNTAERIKLIKRMRADGLIPDRNPGGTGGGDRPTKQQWAKIGGLARSMGWDDGLEDDRLRSFVKRTAKVAAVSFMTRTQASKVITGLEVWVAERRAQDGEVPDAMS